jgi:hemolysin III
MRRSAEQIEELANALSHGLGCVLALAAWPALAAPGGLPQPSLQQAGSLVFALTMLWMFITSSLYHAAPAGPTRQRLQRLDHAAIFLFIAGSCTPFALGDGEHPQAWPLLGAVWVLALMGMGLKLSQHLRGPLLSTTLYLAFGWLAAAAALPVLDRLNGAALTLLVAGGLAYSVGSGFYLLGRHVRYGHLAWHLMVIVGAGCHLQAVLLRSA